MAGAHQRIMVSLNFHALCCFAILTSCFLCGCGSDGPSSLDGTLVLLENTDATSAKCMDGTPGGFYYEKASEVECSNKWIFDLEGGGECADSDSCHSHLTKSLGSSKYFEKTNKWGYLSSGDVTKNPYAYSWNRVFIKYCSQDLWSGTRTSTSEETFGVYFSGHNIVKAVFAHLLARTDLRSASEVVVTGESAGGIGTWINVGWFQDQLPKARTVAVPIAGFYAYAYKYTGPSAKVGNLVDFSPGAWPHHYQLWQSHVDENCRKQFPGSPWICLLSNNSRPSIDVPAFVVEAQTDRVQLQAHNDVPPPPWDSLQGHMDIISYVQRWKDNMTSNLHTQLRTADGFFSPACYAHTDFYANGPFLIDTESGTKYTYASAFGKWHTALGSPGGIPGLRLESSCGLFCANSCSFRPSSAENEGILV